MRIKSRTQYVYFHVRANINWSSNNNAFQSNDEWNLKLRGPLLRSFSMLLRSSFADTCKRFCRSCSLFLADRVVTSVLSNKINISPITGPRFPELSRNLRFADYVTITQDGGKVVRLTHRPLLPPGINPGSHFCWRLSRPQGHSAIGRIMSMKNSNNIWNRTRDLPICNTTL